MSVQVYLETSVVSNLTAWPSRDLIVAVPQQMTLKWWQTQRGVFDLFMSQFVIDEAGVGDSNTG